MQIILNSLISFSIYSIVGLGFWMLYKTHKFFNLGHGAFIIIGGYAVFLLSQQIFGVTVLGLSISIILATIVAGILGMFIDTTLYRTLRKKKQTPLVLLVVSLGLLTIIQSLIALGFNSQYKIIDSTGSFSTVYLIGSGSISLVQIISILSAIVVSVGLYFVVTKTTFGKAFRAIADDTEVSAIVGIPVQKILIIVAGIASALAGLAGALSGVDTGILPAIGFALFLKAVVGDIIGGLESYWGPMLGALLIALLENIVVFYFGGEWRDAAVYILLLVFLLLRPKGILIAK